MQKKSNKHTHTHTIINANYRMIRLCYNKTELFIFVQMIIMYEIMAHTKHLRNTNHYSVFLFASIVGFVDILVAIRFEPFFWWVTLKLTKFVDWTSSDQWKRIKIIRKLFGNVHNWNNLNLYISNRIDQFYLTMILFSPVGLLGRQ